MPLFYFLLACNRTEDVVVAFKPDQKMNPVSRSKPGNRVGLVLMYSANQIVGHANIECPVLSTCQDVNVIHNRTAWVMDSGLAPSARPGMTDNMSVPDASKIPVADLTERD